MPGTSLRCLACNAPLAAQPELQGNDRLHNIPGTYAVAQCASCGSGTTLPLASESELARFYPSSYGPFKLVDRGLVGAVSGAIRWYQGRRGLTRAPLAAVRELPPGRLIDVGCGRGDVAARFVERGWSVVGLEPSAAACDIARTRGVAVRQGTLAEVRLEPEAYDAAVFLHSLEHTPGPGRDLGHVAAALRPGGRLLVTVPNFDSWQRRRFGSRWYHLDLPRHRTHFTRAGLRCLLERSGFAVESVTTSTSTVGLPATIQYALVGRFLFPSGLGLRVSTACCIVVLPLARLLDALHGGGDQLHAVARRESQ